MANSIQNLFDELRQAFEKHDQEAAEAFKKALDAADAGDWLTEDRFRLLGEFFLAEHARRKREIK